MGVLIEIPFFALGASVLLALVLWLTSGWGEPSRTLPAPSRAQWAFAWALLLVAHAPLVYALPRLLSADFATNGDGASHAEMIQSLLDTGFARGWSDRVLGGFPLAVHYPITGWLLACAVAWAFGLAAGQAMMVVGSCALVLVPCLTLLLAKRLGARPAAAGLAAISVALVQPHNAFMFGWEQLYHVGAFAQSVGIACATLYLYVAFSPRLVWLPWAACLAALAHPQVALFAFVGGGAALLALRPARWQLRLGLTVAAALAGAVAEYGPGLGTMGPPFGWPEMNGWRRLGFPAQRLLVLLSDGSLFDSERVPVLSTILLLALGVLVGRLPRRGARLALGVTAIGFALLFCRELLGPIDRLGLPLTDALQPLRAVALVPGIVAIAAGAAWHQLEHASAAGSLGRFQLPLSWAAPVLVLALALPSRVQWLSERVAALSLGEANRCGQGQSPYRVRQLSAWLRAHPAQGRVDIAPGTPLGTCVARHNLFALGSVRGGHADAVGAHVGVLSAAFSARPQSPAELLAWAEQLGISQLVVPAEQANPPPPGFTTLEQGGGIALLAVPEAVDGFVAGCVTERWSGQRDALRLALFADFRGSRRTLSGRTEWVELVTSTGPLERVVLDEPCQPGQVVFTEPLMESGLYEVTVRAPTAAHVSVPVTAYAGFVATLDGAVVPWQQVAPGFLSVRVPEGEHRLRFETDWPKHAGWRVVALGAWLLLLTLLGRKKPLWLLKRGRPPLRN